MSIISKIKGWFHMVFKNQAKEDFQIESITSTEMENMIDKCSRIYAGKPEWVDADNHIKTINFAKSVSSETARLAMLGTKITIDGSARAAWQQEQIDKVYDKLREWIEYGCAYGTIVLKPNGTTVDMITPDNFIVTDHSNGTITGIVFINKEVSENGKKFYTRLEYHRFIENGLYAISNKCYVGDNESSRGKPIAIEKTPWNDLLEEVVIQNVEKPLYGVFKTPQANNVEINSPLGLPIYAEALEELKDIDIAYSRNSGEIYDSERTTLIDSDRLIPSGGRVQNTLSGFAKTVKEMKLPRYVKAVYGSGKEDFYQEINPTLNTDTRLKGINALLSQIGYKVGYSNGYFVFNESTGMVTATQVESDDRRTIQFIKDVRDKIESCFDGMIYAQNVFADLYNLAPTGTYEVVYDFGDITYNREEDRKRWWGYVAAGKVPAWMYFAKFEGMSEEEAKAMVAEAQPKTPTFFGQEE